MAKQNDKWCENDFVTYVYRKPTFGGYVPSKAMLAGAYQEDGKIGIWLKVITGYCMQSVSEREHDDLQKTGILVHLTSNDITHPIRIK